MLGASILQTQEIEVTDNDLTLSGCESDVEVLFHSTWSQSYSIAYEVSSTLIASPEFYAVN